MEDLLDWVDGLRRANSLPAIEGALTGLLAQHGFDHYVHYAVRSHLVDVGRRPIVTNFPLSWRDRYADRRYVVVDPIVRASYQRLTPFTWSGELRSQRLSRAQRAVMGEAAEHGIRGGLTVPIFGPTGRLSILSVVSNEHEKELDAYMARHRLVLHMAALYAYDAIERLAAASDTEASALPDAEPAVKLYPRERECLLWACKGKKSWEIGQILGISDGTVDQYLKSAARKLRVYGRQHAVARAIVLGIIQP